MYPARSERDHGEPVSPLAPSDAEDLLRSADGTMLRKLVNLIFDLEGKDPPADYANEIEPPLSKGVVKALARKCGVPAEMVGAAHSLDVKTEDIIGLFRYRSQTGLSIVRDKEPEIIPETMPSVTDVIAAYLAAGRDFVELAKIRQKFLDLSNRIISSLPDSGFLDIVARIAFKEAVREYVEEKEKSSFENLPTDP